MPNITTVHVTSGIPDSGTGNVSTLDAAMADGGIVTIGATGDAAWSGSGSGTLNAVAKYIGTKIEAVRALLAATLTATLKDSGGGDVTDTTNHALKVNVVAGGGSGGTASSFAAAFPASGTAIGAKNGSNMVFLAADSSNNLKVADASTATLVTALGSLTNTSNALDVNVKSGVNGNGRKTPANSSPVVEASRVYQAVAASQTHTILQTGTGATGDYLEHVVVVPATTSPGAVSITDGAGSDITVFAGGGSSVSNLVPFSIPVGAVSAAGAWKVSTGASVSVVAVGNFS